MTEIIFKTGTILILIIASLSITSFSVKELDDVMYGIGKGDSIELRPQIPEDEEWMPHGYGSFL